MLPCNLILILKEKIKKTNRHCVYGTIGMDEEALIRIIRVGANKKRIKKVTSETRYIFTNAGTQKYFRLNAINGEQLNLLNFSLVLCLYIWYTYRRNTIADWWWWWVHIFISLLLFINISKYDNWVLYYWITRTREDLWENKQNL